MAIAEEEKRIGRFIKKGSKILEKVALTDFSFEEICETPVVTHDNPDSTIIHSKYHEESEINQGIRKSESFNDDLMNETQRRPILQPIDFTEMWRQEMKRKKAKVSRQNYDEDFFYEDTDTYSEPVAPKPTKKSRAKAEEVTEQTKVDDNTVIGDSGSQPNETDETQSGGKYENLEIVGNAIKNLQPHEQEQADSGAPGQDEVETDAAINQPLTNEIQGTGEENAPNIQTDEFIPVAADSTSTDPEDNAAKQYQQRVADKETFANMDSIVDEAKSRGYEEGYRLGEEKGTLESKANAQAMFGKLNDLVEEFSNLKKEVLLNVQQNFFEISQAVSETLIKRELSVDPNAFAVILRKAIADSVENDTFKIKVHPETLASLQQIDDQDITRHLAVDESMEPGDFKIESDMTVVEGKISKLIKEYLEEANLELFDSEDKAG